MHACSSRPTAQSASLWALSVLLALLCGYCLSNAPVARAAHGVTFAPSFSAGSDLGEGATMAAELTFTGSEYHGSPDPVTEVSVHLPARVGGTSAGFPTCSEQALDESGAAGCPAGSLAGPLSSIGLDIESGYSTPGGVVTERVHQTGTIQPVFADKGNTNDDFFFYIEAPGVQTIAPAHYVEDTSPYGRMLKLELPLIESIPGQPFASITSLTLTLGTSREEDGQFISSLTIPQECPVSSMFPWAADVTYTTNASFTEQTHEHTTAETVCPASSGKLATTTTLQVSPASPHVGEVVTYTATVTPKTLEATEPSGSVTFLDKGQPITGCTTQALVLGATSSTASCQLSYPASGTHQIGARYGGDAGNFGSESTVQTVTVSQVELPSPPKEPAHEPPTKTETPSTGGGTGTGKVNYFENKALLNVTLIPSGKRARIGALLKNKGYLLDITGPAAGTYTVRWYQAPQTAKHGKAKPVLVAAGQATFQAAGIRKLFLVKLTNAGRKLLKHAMRVKLTSKGAFAVKDGLTVKEAFSFGVER